MWQQLNSSDDTLIDQVVTLQRAQDRRYEGISSAWVKKWLLNPHNVLFFSDEGSYRLGFSVRYDADKNRRYLSEMGYDGSISVEQAFERIAAKSFEYASTAGFDTFYATQPKDPTLSMNDLYAQVLTSTAVNTTILESSPKFNRVKVTQR